MVLTNICVIHLLKVYKGTVKERNGGKSAVAIKGEKKYIAIYSRYVPVL